MFDDATASAIESPFRTRMLHMAAFTQDYLPKNAMDWFNKPSSTAAGVAGFGGFRKSAGKYVAESFGWVFDAGEGAKGKSLRYMGEGKGFLGSKYLFEQGGVRANKLAFGISALGGMFSAGWTANLMYEGWQEGGLAGAARGLGQSVAEQAVFRKVLVPAFAPTWGGIKAGWQTGRSAGWAIGGAHGITSQVTASSVMGGLTRTGVGAEIGLAARAGGIAAQGIGGMIGAGIGGVLGTLVNPWFWAIAGGMYAVDKGLDWLDKNNRAIAQMKRVNSIEMGGPIADQFGTVSTLRQRSVSAIQNSRINGRMALGNEAALLHR